ncbi:MAG: right-handed parallel beta-helix repeat-containing protein [Planctomycetes bacterium]|nr:right-handed parallel beta-helix repeat-containing protein [Planctomycetota bacterium]
MYRKVNILFLCVFLSLVAFSCEIGINFSAHLFYFPKDFNFGSVDVGSVGTINVEIENPGVAELRIDQIIIVPDSHTNSQEMYISEVIDQVGRSLQPPFDKIRVEPNKGLQLILKFEPLDTNAKSAMLAITHNASNIDSPFEAKVGGNNSNLDIDPEFLDFGKVDSGNKLEKEIEIVNRGTETLTIYALNITGSNDFTIESNSGYSTIEPMQSKNIRMSFMPTVTGFAEAKLNIIHDSAGSPTLVELSGIGVPDDNRSPDVSNPTVTPNIVKSDGTEIVLFTAEITDTNGSADLQKININMSSLLGDENQIMFDDGTNGDVVADDNVYSFEFLIPSGLSSRNYDIRITATDYSDDIGSGDCFLRIYSGNKIYVNDSTGNDTLGTGSSVTPYKTIQKGIDESSTGDWVVIQDGVYKGSGNRDLDFSHNLAPAQTREIILKSETDAISTIIDCEGSSTEEHRAFVFDSDETSSAVVDGFTIRSAYSSEDGGAIYCDGASPTIQNCILINNQADDNGGAIYCKNSSEALILNNTIMFCSAVSGAGIFADNSSITVLNNDINNNLGTENGGGICVLDSSVTIESNDIIDNNLDSYDNDLRGAGLYIEGDSILPSIKNNNINGNSIRSNSGECYGSGLYIDIESSTYYVEYNEFKSNTIYSNTNFAYGGGVFITGENNAVKFRNNDVLFNETNSSSSSPIGGGMYIDKDTTIEIKHNIISHNIVTSRLSYTYAGGIFIDQTDNVTFENNTINYNTAIAQRGNVFGGGIAVRNNSYSITVKNCEIKYNVCNAASGYRNYGSGLFVYADTIVVIEDSEISENSAISASYSYGGGIFLNTNSSATIKNTEIKSNILNAYYYCYGAGVYCSTNTTATFEDCEISNNETNASYDSYGGAIYFRQGNYNLTRCKLNDNMLKSWRNSYGGGFYCYNYVALTLESCEILSNTNKGSTCYGAGLYSYYTSVNLQIKNSLIAYNTADSTDLANGGAIYIYYSIFNIQNCTIASNTAISNTGNANGGAIYIAYTYVSSSINNTILWNNRAISRFGSGNPSGNDFYILVDRTYIIIINNCLFSKLPKFGVPSIHDPYNLLRPNLACIFDSDPYFVDERAGNYRLQHTNIGYIFDSPCIDRGNDSLISANIRQDLDGNLRFVDGDRSGGATIDIGCYEKQN